MKLILDSRSLGEVSNSLSRPLSGVEFTHYALVEQPPHMNDGNYLCLLFSVSVESRSTSPSRSLHSTLTLHTLGFEKVPHSWTVFIRHIKLVLRLYIFNAPEQPKQIIQIRYGRYTWQKIWDSHNIVSWMSRCKKIFVILFFVNLFR